jgi:hypothetical protein
MPAGNGAGGGLDGRERGEGVFVAGRGCRREAPADPPRRNDMAQAIQKITLNTGRDIPFNKLVLSQQNVRKTKAGSSRRFFPKRGGHQSQFSILCRASPPWRGENRIRTRGSSSKARLESCLKAPPDYGPRTILQRSVNALRIRRFLDKEVAGFRLPRPARPRV